MQARTRNKQLRVAGIRAVRMRKGRLRAGQTLGRRSPSSPLLTSPLALSPVFFSPLLSTPILSLPALLYGTTKQGCYREKGERERGDGGEREETVEGRRGRRMCKQGEHDDMQAVARTQILRPDTAIREGDLGSKGIRNKREYIVTGKSS